MASAAVHLSPETGWRVSSGPRETRCPDIEILAAYADHSLTLKEKALTESHLAGCWVCRNTIGLAVLSGADRAMCP